MPDRRTDTPPDPAREPVPERVGAPATGTVTGVELQMSTLRQLAERSDRHLQALVDALPGPVVVAHGARVLLANAAARERLEGVGADVLPAPAPAPGERGALPGHDGAPVTVEARAITWDERDCVLIVAVEGESHGEAAAAAPPAVQDPARPRRTAAAAADVPLRVAWTPVVDVASALTAGVTLRVAGGGGDGWERLQRALVRAADALAGWPDDPTSVVMVPAPVPVDAALAAFVEAVLRRTGVDHGRLWLRVAPHGVPGDAATRVVLRRAGARLALEGFGRDAAGMDRVRAREVDAVVLDAGVLHAGEWDVAQAALSVARHLGLATMASGVRDPAVHARLRALGCRWAEGGLYGPPVDTAGAGRTLGRPAGAP